MKYVTKIDWSLVNLLFEQKSWNSLLPQGEKWLGLADLVGKEKHFPNFHWTGLLPHLMNKKNKDSKCELTKVYAEYPPASWPYALICANKSIGSVVYIGRTHIKSKFTDTLKWIRAQKDIIELNEETIDNETVYVFEFVLGDDMVDLYSENLTKLQHNVCTPISKKLRCEIRSNINTYQNNHNCEVAVKSTFPFRASATNPPNNRINKKELGWMDILWLIYSIHGGDSYKGCLLRQLLSSPCYIGVNNKYTTDETCIGCGSLQESKTIITKQPTVVTEARIEGGNLKSETIITQPPPLVVTKSRIEGFNLRSKKRGLDFVKNSLNKDVQSKRPRPGLIDTKCAPGCRMDSQDKEYPRTNHHSHVLSVSLSNFKWNCLIGNTHNTIHALGHDLLFQSEKTPDAFGNEIYFSPLVHKLCNEYLYCIALSRLMTKDNSLKFEELEECINSAKVPSLIILNMTYSGGQTRRHLIGIVPSVTIDNKTEMHIVDGYHKDLKSFPLNEENLKWCCSGCISYFIEQFVFFTPGAKCLRKLLTLAGPNDNSCGTYITIKTSNELLEFIPTNYRKQKSKRKR